MATELLLLAHGSTDAAARTAARALAGRWRGWLGDRDDVDDVRLCFLRDDEPNAAALLRRPSRARRVILPLFLGRGRHVARDIPALTDGARGDIAVAPPLADPAPTGRALAERLRTVMPDAETAVVFSHGSGEDGAMRELKRTVAHVGRETGLGDVRLCCARAGRGALADVLEAAATDGRKSIAVLPHLLFPGATARAAAGELVAAGERRPALRLMMAPPLGTDDVLLPLARAALARAGVPAGGTA